MAAGRQRRAEAETFAARWKKQWHRVRVGVRRAAVDYFRGDGSDWIALAGLLLTIPVIAATTMANSVWCSPSALVIPIVAGGLLLRPASLLGLYAAAATALIVESVQLGPYTEGPSRVTPGVVLVVAACGFFGLLVAQFRSRVGVPWRRGGTMLFDLRERIRVQSKLPKLPKGWHRRAWRCARRAASPSPATSSSRRAPTAAGPSEVVVLTDVSGKGHGRGLARPAAVGGLRRTARQPAAARLPAGRQRLPAPPGLGRGLRHLHPPRPGPRLRRLRAVLGRRHPPGLQLTRRRTGR
ncbi:PP2C family protein-serine/threonine phosphatase [Streptomyces violaceorubidus]